MGSIFISYRRDDSAATCGRIYDRLKDVFGAALVFKDVQAIPLGVDFRDHIAGVLRQTAVQLVLIGPLWAAITDKARHRRLDDPNDLVRIEVETALRQGIPVIPVLVQGATMPRAEQLPASLRPLTGRNDIPVRYDPDFDNDMRRLSIGIQEWVVPISADRFPARLAELGFTARKLDGVEVILPPLCAVPAGEFLMGSDPKQDHGVVLKDEQPQHRVTLAAFQIARFPVTVAEWCCYMRARGVRCGGRDMDHPMNRISWDDATAYAAWLAQQTGQPWRLPTEAEWEKAARWDPATGQARIYPWGDAFDQSRANTSQTRPDRTTPVGSYPGGASPYGAQDMSGNVCEWTSSVFKRYPYIASDGRERADSNEKRVLRGGSYTSYSTSTTAASRWAHKRGDFYAEVGFRVVLAAPGS